MESSRAWERAKTWLPSPMPSAHMAWMTGSSVGKVWAVRGVGGRVAAVHRAVAVVASVLNRMVADMGLVVGVEGRPGAVDWLWGEKLTGA